MKEGRQDREGKKKGEIRKKREWKGEDRCFFPFKDPDWTLANSLCCHSSGQPVCIQRHPGNDKESEITASG